MLQCFLIEPTDRARRTLRRFRYSTQGPACPGPYSYHNADVLLDEVEHDGPDDITRDATPEQIATLSWPQKCDGCEYVFGPDDEYQIDCDRLYRRADTGEVTTLH